MLEHGCLSANNLRSRIKCQEDEASIARMAYYDSLTTLPNRALFRNQFESAIAMHSRSIARLPFCCWARRIAMKSAKRLATSRRIC